MTENLTNKQVSFIVFGIIVGYGIMPLTKNVVEIAGTQAWLAIMVSSVIAVFFTYIITYLGYVHENKTIEQYSCILVGPFITSVLVIIYIIYCIMGILADTRNLGEIIKSTILINTPTWSMSLLFLSIIFFAASKGLKSIARLCEIFGITIIICFIITLTIIFFEGDFINLRPFIDKDNIFDIFKALPETIAPFIGMELIGIIPLSKKQNGKKIFKYTLFMVILIGVLYILEIEACLGIMGNSVIHYKESFLATIRRIDVTALNFLSRLDGIFIIFWIIAVFTTVLLWTYTASYLLRKQFFKKVNQTLITFIVVAVSFVLSIVPKSTMQLDMIYSLLRYIGILVAGIIPMILFIVTKVKGYK